MQPRCGVAWVSLQTGADPTLENWQLLSSAGQWLTSQAMMFITSGDFHVEPKQLEDCGWVRAIGGFVGARKLATVTPSHSVINFFVVSRDLAGVCEAGTEISEHRPDKFVIST